MPAPATTIDTPLGPVTVSFTCGTATSGPPDRGSTLPSGARVAQWDDVSGVVADALLVRCDELFARPSGGEVPMCWALEWRFSAPRGATPPLTVAAELPAAGDLWPADGQHLIARTVSAEGWHLAFGGPDDEMLAILVDDGRLPASWAGCFDLYHQTACGAFPSERGLTLRLPGLAGDEGARIWLAVAWCPDRGDASLDALWSAVDIGPFTARAAAGLPYPQHPRRRRQAARGPRG
jgi:hypothetical protein